MTRHPEALPAYRTCAGSCGRSLLLAADNYPTRKTEPNRYPWQPSYYRPRCHQCHRAFLADLRAATKDARRIKDNARERANRAAVKASQGMTPAQIKAHRAAMKAKEREALAKAARKAESRRTLRAGRAYDPAKDPVKRMIKERQAHYLSKRLRAGPVSPVPSEIHEPREVEPDYLRQLEALRDKHRAEGFGES